MNTVTFGADDGVTIDMDDDTVAKVFAADGESVDVIVTVITHEDDLFSADMRAYRAPDGRFLLDAPAGYESE